jgi:hypothetical protein
LHSKPAHSGALEVAVEDASGNQSGTAAPQFPRKKTAKGLRLQAGDVDWTSGTGKDATGPGEALLMALAGRPHSLNDLSGPGLPTLRARAA